jgi:hypothetical protein
MGTESKPTENPGNPAQPEKDGALTEDQLKQVSGGKGTLELSSWQMGIDRTLGGGGSGTHQGTTPSVSEIKIKP